VKWTFFGLAAALAWCGEASEARSQAVMENTVQESPDGVLHTTVQLVDQQSKSPRGRAYYPTRVLVRFKDREAPDFLAGSGSVRGFEGDRTLFVVENPPGLSVPEAVGQYAKRPNVLYAEPDFIVHSLDTLPSDPLWSQQWDMTKIAAPKAWDTQTDASDVVVGVIDTGIDFTHPDLQGNLWTNPADGSHGFTCRTTVSVGGQDDYGHGTHVAGTIGAVANNGSGIAGLNWKVQLLSLKFLDSSGSGAISDAILCFDKATALKQNGVNIRVTNNSWGGGGFSQALKDAMARAEAAGMLHACAAGNSSVNADITPMYPAAYDNRGIISVLATDSKDIGASFTNYGLASVDIAAPGVSTLSTVPTGTCALCDPSGYKLLSGTSMATPHVAGVMAGLFHRNPSLSADEARDVVLDFDSYDPLTDSKAASSTTGGRLNFYKASSNPLLTSPVLNGFPSLTVSPSTTASAGSLVTLSASASDPDADPLRTMWMRSPISAWLLGVELSNLFPSPSGNPFSFTAPALARAGTVPYLAVAADGRGGSAQGVTAVTVSPSAGAGLPPAGTLSVSPTSGPVGTVVTINYPVTDPDGGPVLFDVRINQKGSGSAACCFSSSPLTATLNTASSYRIGVQAIDKTLNVSTNSSAVVHIGGAVGEPPVASAVVDKLSGPVPLTVNYDASASYDPDGRITNFYVSCDTGSYAPSGPPTGSCTYNTPGPHSIFVVVVDNDGYWDSIYLYVVATGGSGSSDPAPTPTPSTPSPTPTATLPPTPTPASDLVETGVSNPPATSARGASFSVTDTALNQGAAPAAASTTRYYLSADTLRNGGDKLLVGSRAVPALAPGATSTGTVSVQVPNGTSRATYFLLACADDKKYVSESNEVNNCRASAGTVRVK
jgi:subtilisin family serine protease